MDSTRAKIIPFLNDSEIKILDIINDFRDNPKKFLDKKDFIRKKQKHDYVSFINILDKMPELEPDQELSKLANEEAINFSEDMEYNKYQTGNDFKLKLDKKFSQKESCLIALDDINKIELLIPKIIINNSDQNKKGRIIITNKEYTHIGLSQIETEYGIFIVLIFSKLKIQNCLGKKDDINNIKECKKINYLNKEELFQFVDLTAKSMDNDLYNKYKFFFEILAEVYYEYKKIVVNDELINNFHNNIDFYYSIKCAMKELKKIEKEINESNKDKILVNIATRSFTRNFGGIESSLENIKSLFKKFFTNYNEVDIHYYNIFELIKDNLNDDNGRFLMIISNSYEMKYYIKNFLNSENKNYKYIEISEFCLDKNDNNKSEKYKEDVLNKIKLLINEEIILVVNNAEFVYHSLYDLFLGVNSNFKLILLIAEDQLDKIKLDNKNINIFEKHIFNLRNALNESQINFAKKISDSLEIIKTFKNNNHYFVYNLGELLLNCKNNEIEALIYKICYENFHRAKDEEFIEDEILKKIVPNFCQDIIASVKLSGFGKGKNAAFAEKIIKFYKEKKINNFNEFLEKAKKNKNIIYTFSQIFEFPIPEKYKEVLVEEIDSEKKVDDIFLDFYENDFKYLIFRCNEKVLNVMNNIYNLINNYENNKTKEKIIIFIVHLIRKNKKENKNNLFSTKELISYIDDSCDQYFIDNLKSERNDFLNILDIKDTTELVNSIIEPDEFFDKNFDNIISKFDFKLIDKYSKIKEKEYTNIISHKLIDEKDNINSRLLRNYLIKYSIKKIYKRIKISGVFRSKAFQNSAIDFFQLLENYISSELSEKLLVIINYLEKRGGFFSSILIKENNTEIIQNEIILKQIQKFFENMKEFDIQRPKSRMNEINTITELSIPCSYYLFNSFKRNLISKENIEKYILNENIISRKNINNVKQMFDKYLFEYNKMIEAIKEKFSEVANISDIFLSNQENLKKALFYDYLNIYCAEISNKFTNNIENLINPICFIELLLYIKFNIINKNNYSENEIDLNYNFYDTKQDFNLSYLAEIFLFLESYKDDIIFLAEAFCLLNSYMLNTLEKLKQTIKINIIKEEKTNMNHHKVNNIFYILMESLLNLMYLNIEEIYSMKNEKFYSFFDSLKFIDDIFNRINQKFSLSSFELNSFRNLISLYNIFKNEIDLKDIMKNIMKIVGKESEYLKNKNYNKLKENIIIIKNIISEKYGNNSIILINYLNDLLRQQFKITGDKDYKYELLKIAFESDELIERSIYFINETINIPFPILINKNDNIKNNNNYSFYTKEECENYFLSFINTKKTDEIFAFYENIKSEIFNHVLLYYFELSANEYFKSISDKYKNNKNNNSNVRSKGECEELIMNQNLLYLKKALDHIDNIFENKNIESTCLNNLGKLYSIAYVKLYIKYLSEIYYYCRDKISFRIIEQTLCNRETNSRKVVKIFFFKNLFQYFENYSKFNAFMNNNNNSDIPFRSEYKKILETQQKNATNNYILKENFISLKNFGEKYNKNLILFINIKNDNFEDLKRLINKDFIQNDGLDILFCFLINHLISYYYSYENDEFIKKIEYFKFEFEKISSNLGLSKVNLDLLDKILNIKDFINEITSKKINKNHYTQEEFEIIMNSFRFVLQSSQFNGNNFYKSLLSQKCKNYIDKNYIPGTLPYNNTFINSYYSLNELLRIPLQDTGFYICTCGQYYSIGNCISPYDTYACLNKNCKLTIGGTCHKLLGKEVGQTDHYLIILKEEDKDKTYWLRKDIENGNIPYIFLDEYKKKYVDKYLNKQTQGITKEDFPFFINRNIKVRNLDELSFRLLNYILYSHLFYSNLLGYISDKDLETYIHGESNCIKLIEKNYEIIQTILKEKGINNIKSFMNIIFDKITELMRNIEDMSTIEKRQEFENNIKNYLEKLINNKEDIYDKEEIKYNEFNEKIKRSNPNNLSEIISENYSPLIYDTNEYPNLNYFLLSKYPDLTDMELILDKVKDNNINYCLINQILNNNENFENCYLLENVLNINKLVNKLYVKYNNKIERDAAKTTKILESFDKNENIENIKEDILIPYIHAWNNIKSKCTNYLCWPTMPIIDITMDHTLNYFLPDNGELYGGLYLASAYTFFIDTQNQFIKNIIQSIGPNSLIRKYLSQLNQSIYIQDANEEDIVKINSDTKKILNNMNLKYSMRDIFKKGKIDFKGFKSSLKYDFDSIEKELAIKILSGVKQFISEESKEPVKYISYLFESFRSYRSPILINYIDKYPRRNLTKEEEKRFSDFLNGKKNSMKNILSSIIILIDYIQKEYFNKNKSILSVIKELPNYIEIDNCLKSFFLENSNYNNNFQMFSINVLINIYEIIELLYWEELKKNLNDQYKMPINDEIKIEIKNCFNTLIKEYKQEIANATRKLISRYLCGKRGDSDISEFRELRSYLARIDLLKEDIIDDEEFYMALCKFDEIKFIIKCDKDKNICEYCEIEKYIKGYPDPCLECNYCNCGIRIGQALEFYELITNEILESENYSVKNDKNLNESKNDENNDDQKDN